MTLETFYEKFDQFADAPDAVEKMRELVLNLAVTGKLAPQDLKDEPAIESFPKLASFASESIHNDFPSHWLRVPLGRIGEWRGGGTPSKSRPEFWKGDLPWVSPKDMKVLHIADSQDHISPAAVEESSVRLIPPGSLLLVVRGMILARAFPVALNMRDVTINQDMKALLPTEPKMKDYLLVALRAFEPDVLAAIEHSSHGTCKLRTEFLQHFVMPIPPLAEQKRIVAKVDELMALCDQLEVQQKEREEKAGRLARASLARFADAPTPANLQFLFHKSYSIPPADLRKAILTLAVQGKLVPQDPNDEPAKVCLTRVGIKNTLPSSEGDESLPRSWSRVRFEDIAVTAGGVTLGRKLGERRTVTLPYLRVANVKRGEIDLGVIKEVNIAEEEIERYALRENDLLMTEGGDWDKVGRAAIWNGQISTCLHQNHVFRSRMRSCEISPVWFELYFNSPEGRRYFESASKQTTNLASINMRQVRGCPVPFPPLAEQRRIVAKVGQLMTLVDALEMQLAASREKAETLLSAIVAELTAA